MWKKLLAHLEIFATSVAASRLANMGYLEEAKNLMIEKRKMEATIKELSALTDKELRDIGISRGEIRSVAAGHRDTLRNA
jgi:uncharacterized protein YjiS (DUF1127 family)